MNENATPADAIEPVASVVDGNATARSGFEESAHEESAMAGWLDVGAARDVPLRGSRVVATARGDIAIFKTQEGELFALRDRCPHKGGPLSAGIVTGSGVTCPLHGWVIALDTGRAVGADHGCTPTVEVAVRSGRILLRFAPAARQAA